MKRNPLYSFKDANAIGIFTVPLNSTIHILDAGGTPKFIEIIGKDGLNAGSTIGDLLSNQSLYVDLSTENIIPSEMEKVQSVNGPAWAIFDRVPTNYDILGQSAIDLSFSDTPNEGYGASGAYSFITGYQNTASAPYSSSFGTGTIANAEGSVAFGTYNNNVYQGISDIKLVVGIGLNNLDRKNAFEVYQDGTVRAPELSYSLLESTTDNKILATKEYSDIVDAKGIVDFGKTIKIKRDTDVQRQSYILKLGELVWSTDTKDLWIGDGITQGGSKITSNIELNYIPNILKGVPDGVATLDNQGKIPGTQLPLITISEVFVVNNEVEMIALVAQSGDVAVRTDVSKSFINNGSGTGLINDWTELLTPDNIPITQFNVLSDTPSSYIGEADKLVVVNPTEDGLVFATVLSGGTYVGAPPPPPPPPTPGTIAQ